MRLPLVSWEPEVASGYNTPSWHTPDLDMPARAPRQGSRECGQPGWATVILQPRTPRSSPLSPCPRLPGRALQPGRVEPSGVERAEASPSRAQPRPAVSHGPGSGQPPPSFRFARQHCSARLAGTLGRNRLIVPAAKEEMIFQIPWKHAAKHGWDINKDACLFRSWAIHTGRYKAGEKEPDPKTWKANFRCAMNSLPDIEEVKDQSRNKGSTAVRVYRMLPPLTKNQRKERKSKSSRDTKSKGKRKSCGDSSPDTFSDGLSSCTLPDDHSSYTAHGYLGQDLDMDRALTPALSPCGISSTLPDWHLPVEIMPDSTSDLYNFQVSPMPSTSEATTDEDEEGKIPEDIMKLLEQSEWQPTNVDGKGYLLNEPGVQPTSVYGDFSCKEEPETDSPGGDIGLSLQRVFTDLKNMDPSWLDGMLPPVRLPSIQPIPCAP
ncbi:interferon regulatory factor 1 isoform X2 [Cavia porcellus]